MKLTTITGPLPSVRWTRSSGAANAVSASVGPTGVQHAIEIQFHRPPFRICDDGEHRCGGHDLRLGIESRTNGSGWGHYVHSTRLREGTRNERTVIPDS